jgi:hypothetical protein
VDSILKSFSIGFLLRSVFAGAFFMISYYVASHSPKEHLKIDSTTIFSVVLPVALFAGVTAYGIHRSLLFPIIECCFDSGRARRIRRRIPLVSASTKKMLLRRWDRGAEDKTKCACERARHSTVWADYTHLQYASSLCIALGAFVGVIIVPGEHSIYWPLVGLAVLLFLAAIVSDWRLHSVDDDIDNDA